MTNLWASLTEMGWFWKTNIIYSYHCFPSLFLFFSHVSWAVLHLWDGILGFFSHVISVPRPCDGVAVQIPVCWSTPGDAQEFPCMLGSGEVGSPAAPEAGGWLSACTRLWEFNCFCPCRELQLSAHDKQFLNRFMQKFTVGQFYFWIWQWVKVWQKEAGFGWRKSDRAPPHVSPARGILDLSTDACFLCTQQSFGTEAPKKTSIKTTLRRLLGEPYCCPKAPWVSLGRDIVDPTQSLPAHTKCHQQNTLQDNNRKTSVQPGALLSSLHPSDAPCRRGEGLRLDCTAIFKKNCFLMTKVMNCCPFWEDHICVWQSELLSALRLRVMNQ